MKLSIIIPVYNASETLDQCMQKMVAQHKISREDAAARAVNKDLFR